MRATILASLLFGGVALAPIAPAYAQDAVSTAPGNLSGPDYVKYAADLDNYAIQAGRIAETKSQREDVRGFAKQAVLDHTALSKSLAAALSNADRKITPPSTRLSTQSQAKIDLLRKAPKATFDQLYLQQQAEAEQSALALDQAYAANGADPALKQVATTAVPVVQRHASALAGLSNGGR